jgi:hypothetical protein
MKRAQAAGYRLLWEISALMLAGGLIGAARPLAAPHEAMTQDEMRAALAVGAEWNLLWCGTGPLPSVGHLGGGLHGPGGTYRSEPMTLSYDLTRAAGIKAARCERCRTAWVRKAPR